MKRADWIVAVAAAWLLVPAWGQGFTSPPPERPSMHQPSAEERAQWREHIRESRRQRGEAWQQMSPEERHQLRRDIREAGRELYPRGSRRRRD